MANSDFELDEGTCKSRLINLSDKEITTLYWRQTLKTSEIGNYLDLPESTVSDHFRKIYSTLLPELSTDRRKTEGETFLRLYYFPLLGKYFPTADQLNNWLKIKISIKKELDSEKSVRILSKEKPEEKPEKDDPASKGKSQGINLTELPVSDTNLFDPYPDDQMSNTDESKSDSPQENEPDNSLRTNGVESINAKDSSTKTDEPGSKEDANSSFQNDNPVTPPDKQKFDPQNRSSVNWRAIAQNRTNQIIAAIVSIILIIGCCALVLGGIVYIGTGFPLFRTRSTPAATNTIPVAIPPTTTITETFTITPNPPTSTITPTYTITPSITQSFTPTITHTPRPTEAVLVEHAFKDGPGDLDIKGPYTIVNGALTSMGSTPIILSLGDSTWKNYDVYTSFPTFNTDQCDFYLGVRNSGVSMAAVKFVRAGRLGWWTMNNGKWSQVAGDEHVIPFAPLTLRVIVNDNNFNWFGYANIFLTGYDNGGVEIKFDNCASMDYIKVIKLP